MPCMVWARGGANDPALSPSLSPCLGRPASKHAPASVHPQAGVYGGVGVHPVQEPHNGNARQLKYNKVASGAPYVPVLVCPSSCRPRRRHGAIRHLRTASPPRADGLHPSAMPALPLAHSLHSQSPPRRRSSPPCPHRSQDWRAGPYSMATNLRPQSRRRRRGPPLPCSRRRARRRRGALPACRIGRTSQSWPGGLLASAWRSATMRGPSASCSRTVRAPAPGAKVPLAKYSDLDAAADAGAAWPCLPAFRRRPAAPHMPSLLMPLRRSARAACAGTRTAHLSYAPLRARPARVNENRRMVARVIPLRTLRGQ